MPQALSSGWDSQRQPGVLANGLWFAACLLAPLLLFPAVLLPASTRCRMIYCRLSPFPQKRKKKSPELFLPLYHVGELHRGSQGGVGAREDKCIHGRGVRMLWPSTHQLD